MKKSFSWVLLLCTLSVHAQQTNTEEKPVFVRVDKNNVPEFSDSPVPGSTEIKVKDGNRMLSLTPANLPKLKQEQPAQYKVRISQPADQDTVRENNGTVYVQGQVKPLFSQGLRVTLHMDGQPVGGPSANANFILHNVERGEHKLQIELLDQSGKLIATSEEITFFMHRASIIKPK